MVKVGVVVLVIALASPLLLSLLFDGWVRVYVPPVNFSLDQIPDLKGKTAIVTGPTIGGIGFISALELARKGARVIVGARNEAKGKEAVDAIQKQLGGKANVEYSQLDLADLSSVQKFADRFIKSGSPLHILMNSAGIMACPFSLSKQGIETQFATNHLGHFLLTKKLLPALKKSQPSRIVTTSSAAHYFPELVGPVNMSDIFASSNATYGEWSAYGRSKLANVLFTVQLNKTLAGTQVYANTLHPGGIRTNLQVHVMQATKSQMGEWAQHLMAGIFNPLLMAPEQGAVTQLFLATSPKVEADGIRGKYFHPQARETAPSKYVTDEAAQELWTLSESLVAKFA